jgi:A/G-specific adenine glycosylase
MDLGATVCTAARPACERCPLATLCRARREGRVDELPTRRRRRALPSRAAVMLVARSPAGVLLVKRPARGVWGGLWSLPEAAIDPGPAGDSRTALRDVAGAIAAANGVELRMLQTLAPFEHVFTHFRLRAHPMLAELESAELESAREPAQGLRAVGADDVGPARWYSAEALPDAALPAPIRTLLHALPPRNSSSDPSSDRRV